MPSVQVVGLDHVVLRCADIEVSLAFYCDELGLAPDRVDEWRRGETFFPSVRIDATTLIDLFPAPPDAPDPTTVGRNMEHFCLVIEPADLDALAAHFPDSQRADGLYGAQGLASSLYVHDPDGNVVELRSYPP
ncbi:MAG TPA: VOC family protein, partial [Acidimicrobiia bacterium]|nr:VOC family protein [Acidimicrobiia bacterium]